MSIKDYPWESTSQIRAHYAGLRKECHARYEQQSVQINREEQLMLDAHRKLLALSASGIEGSAQDAEERLDPEGESPAPKGDAQ